MLLRQLQRPSSRSVVALAVWRPALAATTAPLHGSSRRSDSQSSTPPSTPKESEPKSDQDEEQPTSTSAPSSPSPSPSLFEKFFPDEAKQARTSLSRLTSSPPWSSPLFPELPPLAPFDDPSAAPAPDATVPLRATSMLILSAASPHLSEADFLRLGPQGYHVEGWVGGIARVVQARDPDTLRALGHYFVLFDSDAAALAYRDEVARLWELAKAHALFLRRGKRGNRTPVPPGLLKDRGGLDVAQAIRGFTLVPPSQPYRLEASTAASRDRIADLDVGGASFVDRLADRAGSRHLVLVTVDGGRIAVDTLRRAIEEDGVDRNLAWRVTDLEHGILPFGKSILKKYDMDTRKDVAEVSEGEEGAEGNVVDDRKYRRYPRFIVPFMDNAEAQRFVRGWHRRQFKIRMSADGEDQSELSWDETRTLNTSVLW
ncbi:hypothetical protein F4781DRAFT_23818 [Annulohypoxylon bovei var. microspora]|nr:hypothetical protein F4781DRAFT_23818 [Annulohypoxylon bovei var. microspora]